MLRGMGRIMLLVMELRVVTAKRTTNGAADNGLTVTPNGGDTSKTLFIPHSGYRNDTDGRAANSGTDGYYWSALQHATSTSDAWRLFFNGSYTTSSMQTDAKLDAHSIRCVRS